ncbi:unnamed protein product [Gadus morhua 'NCC']
MEWLTRDESSQRHGTSGWGLGVGPSTVRSLMMNYSSTLELSMSLPVSTECQANINRTGFSRDEGLGGDSPGGFCETLASDHLEDPSPLSSSEGDSSLSFFPSVGPWRAPGTATRGPGHSEAAHGSSSLASSATLGSSGTPSPSPLPTGGTPLEPWKTNETPWLLHGPLEGLDLMLHLKNQA